MRRHLSTSMRVKIFEAANGVCDICGGKIDAGQGWEVSHRTALALGGNDDPSNWFPAHRVCHRQTTSRQDIPAIAKAKRREAIHLGAKARSPRGFKGWRKFSGEIVRAK